MKQPDKDQAWSIWTVCLGIILKVSTESRLYLNETKYYVYLD